MHPSSRASDTAARLSQVGVSSLARRALGILSLAALVALALTLVTAVASHPERDVPSRVGGFPGWVRGPLGHVGYVLGPSQFATLVLAMAACYLVALACGPSLRARWTIATIALLHAIFLLGPPLLSSDVFGYLDWARMGALHGLSPYVTASGSVASDAVYGFLGWHRGVSPYGPLFTLGSYALVPLGLPASLWALKALVTLSSLGCVYLSWRCAQRLGRAPLPAASLYGLNPPVLVFAVGGFHNDALVMVAVLGAIWLVISGRERAGALTGALGVGLKTSAGVVMPFLILGSRNRGRALLSAAGAGAGILALSLAVFGSQLLGFLTAVSSQQDRNSGTSVPAQLGDWLGWTGSPPAIRTVAAILGIVVIVALIIRTWRGADWIESAGWATLAVLVTSAYLLPWYVVWVVPLAAIGASRLLKLASIALSLFVIAVRAAPTLFPTTGRHVTLPVAASALLAPIAGGALHPPPTSRLRLQEPVARAFERSWERQHRMVSERDEHVVRAASSRCHPLRAAQAGNVRPWRCRVSYLTHANAGGHVSYLVEVDPRECFTAVSQQFPGRVFERILRRSRPDPRKRFSSCR